jgi:hypothetical protein
MIGLGPVISAHQKVVRRLEALLVEVRTQPRPGLQGVKLNRFLAKRRGQVRKHAASVLRGIKEMQENAVTPAWGKRVWQKFWGQMPFNIVEEDEERLKIFAFAALRGFGREAGKALKISDNVQAAFDALELGPWATKSEMLARHSHLIRIYHPDVAGKESDMAAKVNAARDTLLAYYYEPQHMP